MLVPGLALLAVALALSFGYLSRKRKLGPIQATPTSSIEYLQALAASQAERGEAGALSMVAEVKGTIVCDHPLFSALTERECVYYSMRVGWEYEEVYEEESGGKRIQHTREGAETLAEEQRWSPFFVQDATGRIRIEPEGAEAIAEQALLRHETDEGLPDEIISVGRFTMNAPWLTSHEERRPLAYHFEEEVIAVGSEIYILGEATNNGGALRIQRPRKGGRFLISTKREEELLAGNDAIMLAMFVGACLCAAIGLGLIFANMNVF